MLQINRDKTKTPPKWMTKADVEVFLRHVAKRPSLGGATPKSPNHYDATKWLAIFLLMYQHGLRRSEACMLEIIDYDADRGTLRIYRAKNGVTNDFSLQPNEKLVLDAWIERRAKTYKLPRDKGFLFPKRGLDPWAQLGPSAIYSMFITIMLELGMTRKGYHPHSLRHSIAVHMAETGMDIKDVQDWLGHKNIANTRIYLDITDPMRKSNAERVARLISKVVPKLPTSG